MIDDKRQLLWRVLSAIRLRPRSLALHLRAGWREKEEREEICERAQVKLLRIIDAKFLDI